MLFGSKKPVPPQAPANMAAATNDAAIFDVTGEEFEARVLKASMERPVIVDFWAPWCGPCKQLGPVLEAAVQAAGGQVLMAKVDVDANQELAQALRVQSIPTVYAFFQGRPVDAFTGTKPESEIKAFIEKLLTLSRQSQPDAIDIPEALKAAAQVLAEKDLGTAQAIYAQILGQDANNAPAYAGMIRVLIAAEQTGQAQQLLENAPEPIAKSAQLLEAKTALELAQAKPQGAPMELQSKVEKNPDDHQARIDLAMALFAASQKEEAIDQLLESIRRDREWNEQAARKQLLKLFEALGNADPLTVASRKKLSSLLFS